MITDYIAQLGKKFQDFQDQLLKSGVYTGLFQDLSNSSTFPGFPGPLATLSRWWRDDCCCYCCNEKFCCYNSWRPIYASTSRQQITQLTTNLSVVSLFAP